MASPVLTSADLLMCSHKGPITVTVPPTRSLKAGGNPVLTQSDLSSATIACPNQNPGPPCIRVLPPQSGVSQLLRADGSPVLLAGVQGATNAGTWNASTPGSPFLEA